MTDSNLGVDSPTPSPAVAPELDTDCLTKSQLEFLRARSIDVQSIFSYGGAVDDVESQTLQTIRLSIFNANPHTVVQFPCTWDGIDVVFPTHSKSGHRMWTTAKIRGLMADSSKTFFALDVDPETQLCLHGAFLRQSNALYLASADSLPVSLPTLTVKGIPRVYDSSMLHRVRKFIWECAIPTSDRDCTPLATFVEADTRTLFATEVKNVFADRDAKRCVQVGINTVGQLTAFPHSDCSLTQLQISLRNSYSIPMLYKHSWENTTITRSGVDVVIGKLAMYRHHVGLRLKSMEDPSTGELEVHPIHIVVQLPPNLLASKWAIQVPTGQYAQDHWVNIGVDWFVDCINTVDVLRQCLSD